MKTKGGASIADLGFLRRHSLPPPLTLLFTSNDVLCGGICPSFQNNPHFFLHCCALLGAKRSKQLSGIREWLPRIHGEWLSKTHRVSKQPCYTLVVTPHIQSKKSLGHIQNATVNPQKCTKCLDIVCNFGGQRTACSLQPAPDDVFAGH